MVDKSVDKSSTTKRPFGTILISTMLKLGWGFLAMLLNPRVVIVYELHVGEGEVAHLSIQFTFPLTVD